MYQVGITHFQFLITEIYEFIHFFISKENICKINLRIFPFPLSAGKGRLEVCGDGAGSAVPVDFHHRGRVRDGRHHPAGPDVVRHPGTDRYQDVGDCDDHCKTVHCQTGVIIKHPLPATHLLGGRLRRRHRPWPGVVTAVKCCFWLLFFCFSLPWKASEFNTQRDLQHLYQRAEWDGKD